ncbi:hypothetical protein GCM10027200_18560 [Lentzea nigeriaca]
MLSVGESDESREASVLLHFKQWVQVVGRVAMEHRCDAVVKMAGERMLTDDHQPPPARNGPVRRAANRLCRQWTRWTVTGCLSLVALGSTLWFGIWLGTPAPHQASPAPTTTRPVVVPEAPATTRQPPGVAKPVAPPAPNRVVYGFVQVGDSYYPQEPCSAADQTSLNWQCAQINDAPRNGSSRRLSR